MESLHKATLIGTVVCALLVVVLIVSGYYIACWKQISIAKAGYEQVQKQGSQDYIWHKVR